MKPVKHGYKGTHFNQTKTHVVYTSENFLGILKFISQDFHKSKDSMKLTITNTTISRTHTSHKLLVIRFLIRMLPSNTEPPIDFFQPEIVFEKIIVVT